MWRPTRYRCRRRCYLDRNKRRRGIPAQLTVARQPAPREQLARRQSVATCRHRHQSWPAIALGNDPLLFLQSPTAPCARRDDFKSGNLRHRHMVSHTPMSSPCHLTRQGGRPRRDTTVLTKIGINRSALAGFAFTHFESGCIVARAQRAGRDLYAMLSLPTSCPSLAPARDITARSRPENARAPAARRWR